MLDAAYSERNRRLIASYSLDIFQTHRAAPVLIHQCKHNAFDHIYLYSYPKSCHLEPIRGGLFDPFCRGCGLMPLLTLLLCIVSITIHGFYHKDASRSLAFFPEPFYDGHQLFSSCCSIDNFRTHAHTDFLPCVRHQELLQ